MQTAPLDARSAVLAAGAGAAINTSRPGLHAVAMPGAGEVGLKRL
jgi:hypothetical protein